MQSINRKAGVAVGVRILAAVPAVFLMIMIFRFSMDTGTQSSGLSGRICAMIITQVNRIFRLGWDEAAQINAAQAIEFLVRKCAHVTEYAVLTLTYMLAARVTFKVSWKKLWWITFGATFLYACSDELHQRFVSGRSGQFTDVLVDCIGAVIAIGFVMLIHGVRNRKRAKRSQFTDDTGVTNS